MDDFLYLTKSMVSQFRQGTGSITTIQFIHLLLDLIASQSEVLKDEFAIYCHFLNYRLI